MSGIAQVDGMPNYFFDTTVLVAYFKKEDPRTHELFAEVLNGQATATISAITVAEVWSASDMTDATVREERRATINLLNIVAIDRAIAERGGELRREHNLALPDALIAACAEQAGGRFLSKDPHFNRLSKTSGLDVQVYT